MHKPVLYADGTALPADRIAFCALPVAKGSPIIQPIGTVAGHAAVLVPGEGFAAGTEEGLDQSWEWGGLIAYRGYTAPRVKGVGLGLK